MGAKQRKIRVFKASSGTICHNLCRLFGSVAGAAIRIGLSRQKIYNVMNEGELDDMIVGRLYRMGIDPSELIKEIENDQRDIRK